MIRHFAVWVVIAIVASACYAQCYAQDQKVPFLQMERDNSAAVPQGWSASADGIDSLAAGASPDSLFEPGYRRGNSGKAQSPRPNRAIDVKFLMANGSSAAATVMDYATTRHCVALRECTEGNPMMPMSLGGMIFIGVLSDTTVTVYSYILKRKHIRGWAIAPIANSGLHLWGMHAGLKSW